MLKPLLYVRCVKRMQFEAEDGDVASFGVNPEAIREQIEVVRVLLDQIYCLCANWQHKCATVSDMA